jgi:hypothetical protein
MYAAFDLGQRTIRAVLKRQDGKVVNELKIKRQADIVLKFLKGTNANVVMESGYNYQYLYDLLKSKGYNVKVAHPPLVTFSKSWCSIPIVITFSGMLISVRSIIAPFLSSDGHTCSLRRFCTLITWIEGVTCNKIDISCCPSLIAI